MPCYVSLDIETTSLDPKSGQILEIAAIAFNWANGKCEEVSVFHELINPGFLTGDIIALKMAADSGLLERAVSEGASSFTVHQRWEQWCKENFMKEDVVFVVGKNVSGFDIPWLKEHQYRTEAFHYRTVDVGSVYLDLDQGPESLYTLAKKQDVTLPSHRAMDDARAVIDLLVKKFSK